jgi:hypothetical protein
MDAARDRAADRDHGRRDRVHENSNLARPRLVLMVIGLLARMALAFWMERRVWLTGLGLIALGLLWHGVARARRRAAGGQ